MEKVEKQMQMKKKKQKKKQQKATNNQISKGYHLTKKNSPK